MGSAVPIIIGIIAIAGVLAFLFLRNRRAASLEDRLTELAAQGESLSLEKLELSEPFSERVIVPFFQSLAATAQKMTPQRAQEEIRHKIELAGMSHKLKPGQFSAYRLFGLGIGGLVAAVLFLFVMAKSDLLLRLAVPLLAVVAGYYGPSLWLGQKIKARQNNVIKSLPDALDLLTICVEAGLGFDAAMSKVGEKWDNELSLAFQHTVQEMQLGKLRREALRDMANGLDVSDVTSFAAAIIQADQLGVSMAKVMRIQSEQMRLKRRQRAEEKARQAPVKMMFPLVFFIFPTILIVLLGPAGIKIKEAGLFGS